MLLNEITWKFHLWHYNDTFIRKWQFHVIFRNKYSSSTFFKRKTEKSIILSGMVVNGFINVVITTIERRFGFRSSQTGLIAGGYDIASFLLLVPVSYLGGRSKSSKPRFVCLATRNWNINFSLKRLLYAFGAANWRESFFAWTRLWESMTYERLCTCGNIFSEPRQSHLPLFWGYFRTLLI